MVTWPLVVDLCLIAASCSPRKPQCAPIGQDCKMQHHKTLFFYQNTIQQNIFTNISFIKPSFAFSMSPCWLFINWHSLLSALSFLSSFTAKSRPDSAWSVNWQTKDIQRSDTSSGDSINCKISKVPSPKIPRLVTDADSQLGLEKQKQRALLASSIGNIHVRSPESRGSLVFSQLSQLVLVKQQQRELLASCQVLATTVWTAHHCVNHLCSCMICPNKPKLVPDI